jgi:hypothetical protein
MSYAAKTTVSPERSRAELEQILNRYGASAFAYGYDDDHAVVTFRVHGRIVRFFVTVPALSEFRYTTGAQWNSGARSRTSAQQKTAREQSERQRWRALTLVVKAKLEAIESGITSFEEEFLAHMLLPDGTTVGEFLGPQLEEVYATGEMPPMLPGTPRTQLTERSSA